MSHRPYWRATPAQRKALLRLPLPEAVIREDDNSNRRGVWARLAANGWTTWGTDKVLRRTQLGDLALCNTQEVYENLLSSQLEEAEQLRQEAAQGHKSF